MLISLKDLFDKYNLNISGVIHIGAHQGGEHDLYISLGINNLMYFEPIPWNFSKLKEKVKDVAILYNVALGETSKTVEMWVERDNESMSCSILEPELHLKQYPNIKFNEKINVNMITLDSIDITKGYNFINMDVQGYELNVLKGATTYLNNIDYIYCEVNRDEVYKNCARVEDLDDFLKQYNFNRVETAWLGDTWGDALYIKNNNNSNVNI